jgi:hypothetical protein
MTSSPGQSYISGNGGATWIDVYSYVYPTYGNLSIKALAGEPNTFEAFLDQLMKSLLNMVLRLLASFKF